MAAFVEPALLAAVVPPVREAAPRLMAVVLSVTVVPTITVFATVAVAAIGPAVPPSVAAIGLTDVATPTVVRAAILAVVPSDIGGRRDDGGGRRVLAEIGALAAGVALRALIARLGIAAAIDLSRLAKTTLPPFAPSPGAAYFAASVGMVPPLVGVVLRRRDAG